MRVWLAAIFVLSVCCGRPSAAHADNTTKEFIMSCTYGVLAGTLVGAASLAFTSKPGDNLRRVARGASLGLYTGILLGLYVVYIVPGMEADPDQDPIVLLDRMPVLISPTFAARDNQMDGLKADWTVLKF
jgi:hypothetical protein